MICDIFNAKPHVATRLESVFAETWLDTRHKDNEILSKRQDAAPIPIGKLPEKVGEQVGRLKGANKKAAREREEVLEIIKAKPGITRDALMKQTGFRRQLLSDRVHVLCKQGKIRYERFKHSLFKYYPVDET